MLITRRRLQFLQIIHYLYESENKPVHYVQVAESMGISKWSAYEMLKRLEREGLLTSCYEVNQSEKFPGRPMVMFVPTDLLNQTLAAKASPGKASPKEWKHLRERLLSLYENPKKIASREMAEQLLKELPGVESPLFFSAYVITLLITQLQTLSEKRIGLIKKLVEDAVKVETGLAMFAGAIIGSMLKTAPQSHIFAQLTNHLSGFQKQLAELNQAEQSQLMDFLDEALARAV